MTGYDIGITPPERGTTLTSIAPHQLPKKIWSIIETYFKKYDVEVRESYPQAAVENTVVSWRLLQRTPGGGPKGIFRQRGAGFSNIVKVDKSGWIYMEYTQEHMMDFEFGVFSTSAEIADEVAWELENAVVECEGPLKEEDPGITLSFIGQFTDDTLQQRHQDDIVSRYVRFKATVPVRRVKPERQLQRIEKEFSVGVRFVNGKPTVRVSNDTAYYIPISSTEKVLGIQDVYLISGSTATQLKENVDYKVKRNENDVVYLEWQDDYGATPSLGSQFLVNYTKSGVLQLGMETL